MPSEPTATVAVLWDRVHVRTDGEDLSIVAPACFDAAHEPYLRDALAARVGPIFGTGEKDAERVQITTRPGSGSPHAWERYGEVVIGPVSEPWPDMTKLRAAIELALADADQVAGEQRKRAESLLAALQAAD